MHHDALEFPGGKTVLLTELRHGQHAVVLQLPVAASQQDEAEDVPAVTGHVSRTTLMGAAC